ncbi:MAG: hypothetical protein IKV03_00250 [Alphaproteobacteria bacterium]|nr:hypothetical protein [Alphaproteobacteria bacterium]
MQLTGENGRSMVEILGLLSVVGVLSVGGVMGYQYAVNKNKANRILNDVQLSYVNINASQNIVLNQLTPVPFAPLSGYPIFTQRVAVQEGQADVVIAQNVEQKVCDHLTDMVQKTRWKMFLTNEGATSFTPLTECAEDMMLAFSWANINEIPPVCDKECPENMTCGGNNECVCATGFEVGEDGSCQKIVCDYTNGIEVQTTQYCCEQAAGIWDATQTPSCTCPEGATFNGTMCLMKDWCSYKFTVPEMVQAVQSDCAFEFKVPALVQAVQSDCAFDFTVPETVTAGESEVSLTPVSGQTCGTGEYCVLNWTNGTCTSNASTYGTNTTTRLYGRCAPLDEHYNVCKTVENGEVSLTPNKECAQENTYCSILWGNQTCKNVGTYGANTQTDLYGVCLSYDGNGEKTCPFK